MTFDCRKDASGKDPDGHSPILRRAHQLLWTKRLPNGNVFTLDISGPKPFLLHRTPSREMRLTSDRITCSYENHKSMAKLVERLSPDQAAFAGNVQWRPGACIVFPGEIRDRKPTINGVRGLHNRIAYRFDLTLECIRRHYFHLPSPLEQHLSRYSDFFALFGDFGGYVDFFLLQDLVNPSDLSVNFFLPFDEFESVGRPGDFGAYSDYLIGVEAFDAARVKRTINWCKAHLRDSQDFEALP